MKNHATRSKLIGAIVLAAGLLVTHESHAIPAFSREYGVSCGTCHSAFPELNSNGEAFRISGYRRFEYGRKAEPTVSPIKIGDRLVLPANIPISFSTTAGYFYDRIDNKLTDGSSNTFDPEDEFRREQSSFELASVEIQVATSLGNHLSFFMDAALAELEPRQFYDPEVRAHGAKVKLEGPGVPERVFVAFNDLFSQDLLNIKGGVIDLPTPFSVEAERLTFFQYLIYDANALDVISWRGADHFIAVPGATEEGIETSQFRLSKHQIGAEVFGRATIEGMYFDYALGGVNGNNINTDNNGTKDFVGRLSLTFPIGDLSTRIGGFGYYSGNTLDELTTTSPGEEDAQVAVAYENELWRAGPDISFTYDGPFYAKLFSQILFARDEDPTGFGKPAEWWGGFVQAEGKPLDSLIVYARYDWIDGDRFNDTGVSSNGVNGTIGAVDPHIWDVVFGTQYFLYDNFKLFAEYRHGVKDLNPGISPGVDPANQLDRTEDNSVFGGFRLVF